MTNTQTSYSRWGRNSTRTPIK